jgi:uncharacterized protein (DUF433 family)
VWRLEAVAIGVKNHVVSDENGAAWISGANTKVIQVVLDKLAYGWSPEEIHFQHPHLSLAQIHSALAYYYENKNELDAEIERQSQEAEPLKPPLVNPTLRHKLLDVKKPR